MSKVLLINGSPNKAGCTYTALREVEKSLNKNGVETEIFHIGKGPVQGCTGCGGCGRNGKCVFDDGVNRLVERLDEFDGLVIGSPVYYASPNGALLAIEGITSPDGRVLGKMGHSERSGDDLYKNVTGDKYQPIFEGGVNYFKL